MERITMADKARFYAYKREKAMAKLEASIMMLKLIKANKQAYGVSHPKAKVN